MERQQCKDSGGETKFIILSMICAVDERTVIFGHPGGKVRPAELSPGDVLVFRADKCHQGSGLVIDRPPALGAHIFLNPIRGLLELGKETGECEPHRARVTHDALVDSSRLKERLIGPPHMSNENKNIMPSCQLCRALLPDIAVKKSYTKHCERCKVTLCAAVCWDHFHDGVGLEGKVTIGAYKEAKMKWLRRHKDSTPVYDQGGPQPVHQAGSSSASASEDVMPVYPADG